MLAGVREAAVHFCACGAACSPVCARAAHLAAFARRRRLPPLPPPAHRRGWQGECAAVLRDTGLWQRCGAAAPETAEGLRGALGVLSGDEGAVAAAAKVRCAS